MELLHTRFRERPKFVPSTADLKSDTAAERVYWIRTIKNQSNPIVYRIFCICMSVRNFEQLVEGWQEGECQCNGYPLKHHFHIHVVKLGYTGYTYFSYFWSKT